MNSKRFENGLALVAALIVLIGVGSAANNALAEEAGALDATLKIVATTTS